MSEMKRTDEKFTNRVEEKVVNRLSDSYKVTHDFTSFLARVEGLNIVVAIINAVLAETQKEGSENKIPDNILGAVQAAVNSENEKTAEIFKTIEAAISKTSEE